MLSRFQDQGKHNARVSSFHSFNHDTNTQRKHSPISLFGAATIKISRSVSLRVSAETGKAAPLRNNPSVVNWTF